MYKKNRKEEIDKGDKNASNLIFVRYKSGNSGGGHFLNQIIRGSFLGKTTQKYRRTTESCDIYFVTVTKLWRIVQDTGFNKRERGPRSLGSRVKEIG